MHPEKVGVLLDKGVVAVVYIERKYPWLLHQTCDKAPPAARDSSEVVRTDVFIITPGTAGSLGA